MKTKLLMKYIFGGCCFFLLSVSAQATERGEAPRPQRGYPVEVAYVKTPVELMNIHIATIEAPVTPLAELARVTEVDKKWEHAKAGDEIYDITRWFPLNEMRSKSHGEELRWVYYNQTNGYIIANADQFLKSSIYDFVSSSFQWSRFKPRLQVIYLEMSDEVELNFKAIQNSEHEVLLRGSAVLKFQHENPEDFIDFKFGSPSSMVCSATIEHGYFLKSYALQIKLSSSEEVYLENDVFIAPNQWLIHECGISDAGKRKVLAMKIDHVNYSGARVHFPVEELRDLSFGAGLVSGDSEDPFIIGGIYRAYKVPVDMFDLIAMTAVDPVKMKDVTKVLQRHLFEMDGFFFRSRGLLIARGDAQEHKKLSKCVAELSTRYNLSNQCVLSFYEINNTKERGAESWTIDDLLSANPIKLGSIGSMLGYTLPATTRFENSECTMRRLPPQEEAVRSGDSLSEVDLQINLKLDMSSMKLNKNVKLQVKMKGYSVRCLGKNPKNNKLIMMVVRLSEIEPTKK